MLNDQGKLKAQWWCGRKAAIDIDNAEIKIFLFRLFDTLIYTGCLRVSEFQSAYATDLCPKHIDKYN